MNMTRIAALAQKEWREILRDRLFFALSFVVPALLMLLFGYGLSLDVENIPVAIHDLDRTPQSRDYAYRFIHSRYFDFKGYVTDESQAAELLGRGAVRAVIVIGHGFGRELQNDRPARVQTLLDGTFPYRTQVTKGYIEAINTAVTRELLADYMVRVKGLSPTRARVYVDPVRLEVRYLYNQGLKSSWGVASKLIMALMLMCPPFLTALGVVREKESGAIYNIYASNVSRAEFLVGKLNPYFCIAFINAMVLWGMACFLFGAPFKGSVTAYLFATVLYVLCSTGIGLLISILVGSQVAAMIVTAVVTAMPSMLYSGLLTPVASMNWAARIVAAVFPSMYYGRIIESCFLKGLGWANAWSDMLVLAGYGAALFAVGYAMFHKRGAA